METPKIATTPFSQKDINQLVRLVNRVLLLVCALCFFMVTAGAVVALMRMQLKVATVDMQRIIAQASQTLAKSYPQGNVPPSVMENIVEHIKETAKHYGHDHQCVVVAKGAVLNGDVEEVEDITEVILKTLAQEAAID